MDDYEYYSLFLTQESKNRLAKWLFFNGYGFANDIIKAKENWYLDHVTLLHSLIAKYHPQLEVRLEALTWMQAGNYITFEVSGIGESHNTLAFRCNIIPYFYGDERLSTLDEALNIINVFENLPWWKRIFYKPKLFKQ